MSNLVTQLRALAQYEGDCAAGALAAAAADRIEELEERLNKYEKAAKDQADVFKPSTGTFISDIKCRTCGTETLAVVDGDNIIFVCQKCSIPNIKLPENFSENLLKGKLKWKQLGRWKQSGEKK